MQPQIPSPSGTDVFNVPFQPQGIQVPSPFTVVMVPTSLNLQIGQTATLLLAVSGDPLSGQIVTWTNSNPASVVLQANGYSAQVRGLAYGTPASITATVDGIATVATVTIVGTVTTVTVTPPSTSVIIGGTQQFVATVFDQGGNIMPGQSIIWLSANNSIVLITQQGLATGISGGSSFIVADVAGVLGSAMVTVSSVFATPNILNNASFEAGDSPDVWDGFTDWTGTQGNFPFASGAGFSLARTNAQAFSGIESVAMGYAATPNASASIKMVSPAFSGVLHLFYRVYFRVAGGSTQPDQSHKWLRTLYTLVGCDGGLYLDSPGGGISWANVESSPGNAHTPLQAWSNVTQDTWHYIEVEYDRTNWNVLPGPRARFWYDGNPLIGGVTQLQATSYWGDVNGNKNPNNGNGDVNYPYLYANGTAAAIHPVTFIDFDDTWNQGNTGNGTIYYDRVAISTAGRIGP